MVDGNEFFIPLTGVIDIDLEKNRLDKQIEAEEGAKQRLEKRLSNKNYVERAPAHIVQESRDALTVLEDKLSKLRAARADLEV